METIDGSANEGEDYIAVNEILTFEPYETEKEVSGFGGIWFESWHLGFQIGVTIVDDNQWEPDEEFFLKLTTLQGHGNGEVKLGRTSIMEITILNDDGESVWSTSESTRFAQFQTRAVSSLRNAVIWSKRAVERQFSLLSGEIIL